MSLHVSSGRWPRAAILLSLLMALSTFAAMAEVEPHPGMLRDPDIGQTHIVFSYAQDLWLVPREGGMARPLASPEGSELRPRFSADGKQIAFVGNYDGNRDLYVIPVDGGIPYRVTHHPDTEVLNDWTPDGDLLFFFSGLASYRIQELYTVDAKGGMYQKLPVPWGSKGSIDAKGEWLAYTQHTRDMRTWKRYRGGMATDLWLFNLETYESRKVTDWEGTDTEPMWHGSTLYYLSDRGKAHRMNVWSFDPVAGTHEQLTTFSDFDIKYASIGPGPDGQGEIVLQNGPALYALDLGSKTLREVKVTIPGDRPTLRPRYVDASEFITSWSISPSGKRAVVSARGDVWTLPKEHGTPMRIEGGASSAERNPSWSPDARHVAYFSDASGEYELYVTQADGRGETKRLTKGEKVHYYNILWSPKSDRIAFTDNAARIFVYDMESEKTQLIAQDPWAARGGLSWSADGRFLAYDLSLDSAVRAIFLHDFETGETHQLTSGVFNDSNPTFDRKGEYLVYNSNRHFSPRYADIDTTFIYAGTEKLMLVPLTADKESPFAPKFDQETWDDDEETDGEDENGEKKDDEAKDEETDGKDEKGKDKKKDKKDVEVKIDLEGFESRAVEIPVDPGNFGTIAFTDSGHLLYGRRTARGEDGKSSIVILDLKDDKYEEKTVVEDTPFFELSADGKSLLYAKNGGGFIQPASPGSAKDAKRVVTDGMEVLIDPRVEWKQVFVDAWRRYRNFFYDPNMHGLDWEKVRRHYEPMLDDCVTRSDVGFVIREMISELNVGHAYYRGAPPEDPAPRMSVGLLGADLELHDGAYRIKTILRGGPWDTDALSPLDAPALDVKEGDYVLAVNGQPVDAAKDPWASFQGLAGKTVELTVSDAPEINDEARHVVVELLGSENALRYRAWVEKNRQYVAEKSGGKIGYIYVPNTGIQGQNELVRQYTGQLHKDALIIDERWNGGGQIPTRFIEMLDRPITNYWARRHGKDWPWPPDAHHGPKAMLINGLAGSGGDAFPFYFKQAGLGPLIGERTWGGLVGISGLPGLVDGAAVTVPGFAFFEKDGTWGIEGHGVDPDIEVGTDPAEMVDGSDPQIDKAVEVLLEEIEKNPYTPPKRPESPDRRGMGITPEDK